MLLFNSAAANDDDGDVRDDDRDLGGRLSHIIKLLNNTNEK